VAYLRKYGVGFSQNEAKTLAKPVELAQLADRIQQPQVRAAVLKYTYHPAVFLWDFGVRASQHLRVGDVVYIQSEDKLYYCQIHEMISDPQGEIGDHVGWHRIQQAPWARPVALKPCPYLDGLARAVALLDDKATLEENFYRLRS
jgi:hypothetical protein